MKRTYKTASLAVVVIALGLAAPALEQGTPKGPRLAESGAMTLKTYPPASPSVFLLMSKGEIIAELKVSAGSEMRFSGSTSPSAAMEFNSDTRTITASNGVAIQIMAGTNSVTVRTDALQSAAGGKPLFPVEQQSGTSAPKLVRLKSNGEIIAELRIPKGTGFDVTGHEQNYDATSERHTAKGDVTLQILRAGSSPVVVKADEIEAL